MPEPSTHPIATLDTFGETLADFGGGLGVTDAMSCPAALDLPD
jgi:hypothetical protein